MTTNQIQIAEDLVARIKQDGKDSIDWVKHQENHKLDLNDVQMAVFALKDINIIDYYPTKPQSIRFTEPNGNKFTTFAKYRKKQRMKAFFSVLKFATPIAISLGTLVWTIYHDSNQTKSDKVTEGIQQSMQSLDKLTPTVRSLDHRVTYMEGEISSINETIKDHQKHP